MGDAYENILLRFNMALQLNNESCDTVCEAFMKRYFMDSFSKEANAYNSTSTTFPQRKVSEGSYFGKALNKIGKWANRPSQINYKILRAYLQLSNKCEFVAYARTMGASL